MQQGFYRSFTTSHRKSGLFHRHVFENSQHHDFSLTLRQPCDQLSNLSIDDAGTLVLDVGFCAGAAYFEPGMTVDELVEKAWKALDRTAKSVQAA